MKEVETLIPHRTPFLYLDKLVSASHEEIVGTKIFSDSDEFLKGSFPASGFVPGVVLIEAMAQCGGAGIRQLGLGSGIFAFASIENASFKAGVEYGAAFKMVVRNIKISARYFRQSGVGYVEGQACVESTWTCVKIQ